MPTWSEIFYELQSQDSTDVKNKYINNYCEVSGREVIAYYTAFNTRMGIPGLDINHADMTGFTNAVSKLDVSKGLDLILHTPGGDPTAAERIVKYLRQKFDGDIRVIVPAQAMSAGTMIAFSSKEIIMTKHSCLGPIDPQYNGLPIFDLLETLKIAKEEIEEFPEKYGYWHLELQKFQPGAESTFKKIVELSDTLAKEWLLTGMYIDEVEKVDAIVSKFNENKMSKIHSRPFDYEYCLESGLKVILAEENQEYQDALLSLHHVYTILLENTNLIKIIESNNLQAYQINWNSN